MATIQSERVRQIVVFSSAVALIGFSGVKLYQLLKASALPGHAACLTSVIKNPSVYLPGAVGTLIAFAEIIALFQKVSGPSHRTDRELVNDLGLNIVEESVEFCTNGGELGFEALKTAANKYLDKSNKIAVILNPQGYDIKHLDNFLRWKEGGLGIQDDRILTSLAPSNLTQVTIQGAVVFIFPGPEGSYDFGAITTMIGNQRAPGLLQGVTVLKAKLNNLESPFL